MADKTYQKSIPATKSLKVISRLIHQEELEGLSEFKLSKIATVDGAKLNLVTFKEVGVSNVPDECEVIEKGDSPTSGATKKWDGDMVHSKGEGPVELYRLPEE